MYHHRITYKPSKQERKGAVLFYFACMCLTFASIGCLLAWRG